MKLFWAAITLPILALLALVFLLGRAQSCAAYGDNSSRCILTGAP